MQRTSLEVFTKYQKIICLIYQADVRFDKPCPPQYNKAMIKADEIIKSNRKTVSLSLDKDGRVIVRAPLFYTDREIGKIILESQSWLERAVEGFEKSRRNTEKYRLCNGGKIPILGEDFDIAYTDGRTASIEGRTVFLPAANPEGALEKMFKRIATGYFKERLDFFCGKSGLSYENMKITRAKTRWGSCNSDRNICFSVFLVMCPLDVIDYVSVHEMCHLKYMNHSKDFWAEVEKYVPDYRAKKQWLRDNRAIVSIVN